MGEARRKSKGAIRPITSAEDDRISCFHYKNYDLRHVEARALAWLIQIAVRHDLMMSIIAIVAKDDPVVMLQGHFEILSKTEQIRDLIRRRHLVDEEGLASIGLTLYNFPTLSSFFVASRNHKVVREATVREIREQSELARALVLNSGLAVFMPDTSSRSMTESEQIDSLVGRMTLTTLKEEAGLDSDQIGKIRYLAVDMGGTVKDLREQFLALLDRQPRLKRCPYDDWEEYGVLPCLDLEIWENDSNISVDPEIRTTLLYRQKRQAYGPDKVSQTTRPHLEKLWDTEGPVFKGLLADASEQFHEVISKVREAGESATCPLVQEALARWFPRTFPFNFPDFERVARMFPDSADTWRASIEMFKINDSHKSISERIRSMSDTDDGTAVLRVRESLAFELGILPT